jgi:hypothetical protein
MPRIFSVLCLFFLGAMFFLFPILPYPLSVQHADAASMTLAWNPNSEPDIAGYKLYYGTVKGTYEFAIDAGKQTSYTIPGLPDGVDYYFAVTAYNVYGFESGFSDEVSNRKPIAVTISLASGMNLISLPLEPLNPSISALTEKLSPCLIQVFAVTKDAEGNDSWLFYDPSQLYQNTLSTMESGKGYWVQMACPGEMTIIGNRTTNPITLIPGLNLVGYNGLTPLPASAALSSIANKYNMVWAYKEDQWLYDDPWLYHDPYDEAWGTLEVLTPGSGYYINVTEETTLTLPYIPY